MTDIEKAGGFVMGLFANVAKLGLAKKGFDTLRKPENQRKIKDAAASIKAKRNKGTSH
ncbi:MAG: hypothetical protein WKF73_06005 [Nocardioidaceae bacterium]